MILIGKSINTVNKYEKIDIEFKYNFLQERKESAKKAGYKYISEHIVKTYRKHKSLRKTGEKCCNISPMAVSKILKLCNEPIKKPGGKTWTKLEYEDIILIRSYKYVNQKIYKNIANIISKSISERTGKNITITWQTVKNVWIKKTHNE